MAQLSDDCFAFGGPLMRLDQALDDLAGRLVAVTKVEHVAIASALGRVAAADVCSPIAIPGFDNSAVDGYAVRFGDLAEAGSSDLPVTLRLPAGPAELPALLPPRSVARIFTGAPMPAGADTVFMQEDVTAVAGRVHLPAGLKRGANRRLAGEDFAVGERIVPAGARLLPQHVAGLAAAGLGEIAVRTPLRVAYFSTGNEIVAATGDGQPPPPGKQFDSNRPLLAALLALRGMEGIDLGILPDDATAIAEVLSAAGARADVVLTSGGVSTGEEDHVKAAVERAGRLDFWRLAIKPGRPIAMGSARGVPILGMPGNPAAVFVTFTRFVGPVLDMLAGARPCRPVPFEVVSGFDYRKKPERREYLRARLRPDADGRLVAERFAKDGAALISSLIAADGLVELGEDITRITKGETIAFLPFAALMG